MNGAFSTKKPNVLLRPPTARAAFSDRTAWIMATLSRLAYEPFDTDEDREALEKELEAGRFSLVWTVNVVQGKSVDTQAILVNQPGEMSALAFRGTEFKGDRGEKGFSLSDLRSDLDAVFVKPEGAADDDGNLSRGFLRAFEAAWDDIEKGIKKLQAEGLTEPLYITGHSLGAALATIAARELEGRLKKVYSELTVAACYTFCSPRVGDGKWVKGIKVPVYRVVNGCDGVPLIPFSDFVYILLRKIPILGWGLKDPIFGFVGYQHVGAIKYLIGDAKDSESVDLLQGSSATWKRFFRVSWALFTAIRFLAVRQLTLFAKDHSIGPVVEKLRIYAERRN